MWYCSLILWSNLAFTNRAHSRNPYRGVFTQFLFCDGNILYLRLFPGEILTNTEKWIRQSGGLMLRLLY